MKFNLMTVDVITRNINKNHMLRMLFLIIIFSVSLVLLADEDDHWEDDKHGSENEMLEELSEGLGTLTLWGFVLLNGLHYYSMGFKRLPKNTRTGLPEMAKLPLKWKVRFRKYHYWGNPLLIGIAWLHGITAEASNLLVWSGWGVMLLLALSGFIMKLQRADHPGAKITRLLHMQHLMSIIMVIALIAGHVPLD
jgi:hypothetical protein